MGGRPRFLDWHLERLTGGARRLGFPAPDARLLRADIAGVATEPRCVVKLVLTRGIGVRGYRPPRNAAADAHRGRIALARTGRAMRQPRACGSGWCRTRLARNAALAGLKHLNRLEQVLARAEWDDGAMDEGLMQDDRGRVIAATQAQPVRAHRRYAGRRRAWTNAGSRASCGARSGPGAAEQGTPVEERDARGRRHWRRDLAWS